MNHRIIFHRRILDSIAHGARHRQGIQMNQILLGQFVHHGRNAARFVEVHHMMLARRAEFSNVRRAAGNLIKERCRNLNPCFMGNRREVQHRIGRTANRHIHRDGIFKGLLGQNITRTNVVLQEFHHHCPGAFGEQTAAARVSCRNRAIPRKCHSQHFRQGVHCVGGEEPCAGATARAAFCFQIFHFLSRHIACRKFARCFKGLADTDIAPLITAGQHGAAGNHNGRNVKAGSRHQHTGHNLVAVRNQNQRIETGSHGHRFHGISDKFPAGQRVFHARMAHSDTIADTDSRKFNGRTASSCYTELGRFRNLSQMNMSGNNFIEGVANTNKRLVEILRAIAIGMKQGTVGAAGSAFFYIIANHSSTLLSTKIQI